MYKQVKLQRTLKEAMHDNTTVSCPMRLQECLRFMDDFYTN